MFNSYKMFEASCKIILNKIVCLGQGFILFCLSCISVLSIVWLCMSLGYFVGIMLKINPPISFIIEIVLFGLLMAVILFPLIHFYLMPKLQNRWGSSLLQRSDELNLFIQHYEKNKEPVLKPISFEGSFPSVSLNKLKPRQIKAYKLEFKIKSFLRNILLKIPFLRKLYIQNQYLKQKKQEGDYSFLIGQSIKSFKIRAIVGFSIFFFMTFIISTGVLSLFSIYVAFGFVFLWIFSALYLNYIEYYFWSAKNYYKKHLEQRGLE